MSIRCDVLVAGLGAMGAATLYQLARRGIRPFGLDRLQPPHDRGSSHGDTRITRLAIGEGAHFVPFVRRSHEIWRDLEVTTGRSLLRSVGGIIYGSTAGCARPQAHGAADFLQTTIDVARQYGIGHEILTANQLAERFPQFRWQGDESGYFEPEAGFVRPEECIAAQLAEAVRLGASTRVDESVLHWTSRGDSVEVTTTRERYEVGHLFLCAGAWLPELIPVLKGRARVFRQVQFWFEPEGPPDLFTPDRMPVFIRVPDTGTAMFYGFPVIDGLGGGLKIAGEQFDRENLPDEIGREVGPEEAVAMYALAGPHLRISPRCVRTAACRYTVTYDFNFIIDHAPTTDRVWFASACSGHGFKHSAAVGEALAEVIVSGRTHLDLAPFHLDRLMIK